MRARRRSWWARDLTARRRECSCACNYMLWLYSQVLAVRFGSHHPRGAAR
jgi:hypothetical protein